MNSILLNLLFSGLGFFLPQFLPMLQKFGVGQNNEKLMQGLQGVMNTTGSLASLFGNSVGQYANYQRQLEQQQYERGFAREQYLYNQEQNLLNRQLSSPIGQITAYKRAGLSPDLLFGQLSSPFMSSGVSQPIPGTSPQINSMESLQASNLLGSTEKLANENKQLTEILKGIKFDNVEKEFNAILHDIFKNAVRDNKDNIEYGINNRIQSYFDNAYSNAKKSAISAKFITEIYNELVNFENGDEVPTKKLQEIASLFIDNDLQGFRLENVTKNLALYNEKARYNDREFYYISEKLTQECINAVNELSKTNAEIERNFLNGDVTKETFFKALLLVLGRGIGGVTINRKNTDVHNETSNSTYNEIDKFFDNRGRKNN